MAYLFDTIFSYGILTMRSKSAETEPLAYFNTALFVVSVIEPEIFSIIYFNFDPVRLYYLFICVLGYQVFCTYSPLYQMIVDE